MAIKHGYDIIPCASVGTEDMLDIMANINVEFARKGQFIPLAKMSPGNLQKLYFWVGEPISTAKFNGEWEIDAFAREIRDLTKTAVEDGIKSLQEKQSTDPDRYLLTRALNSIKKNMTIEGRESVPTVVSGENTWVDFWYKDEKITPVLRQEEGKKHNKNLPRRKF